MSEAGTSSEESTASSSARVRSDVPWPILLERAATALDGGDTAAAWKLLDDICLSPTSTPTSAGTTVFLCGDDGLISTAKAAVLSSEAAVQEARRQHKKAVTDVLLQVTNRIEQARPRQDVIHAVPNEILIEIGGQVLFRDDNGDDFPTHDLDRDHRRDLDRIALTSVCRRWRAVFSLGEFWADLTLGVHRLNRKPLFTHDQIGTVSRKKLDAFLAKGDVVALDSLELTNTGQLAAVLEGMRGRSGWPKYWQVSLPRDRPRDFIWRIWTGQDTFRLERLSIDDHDRGTLLWSPPRGLDVSSLAVLEFDDSQVDLVALSLYLPHLRKLRLRNCDLEDPGWTNGGPVVIQFPDMETTEFIGEDADASGFRLETAVFDLPRLVHLCINIDYPLSLVTCVLPPTPRPHHPCLARLVLDTVESEDNFLQILRRHPALIEVSLALFHISAKTLDALASGCCPALRVLRAPTDDKDTLASVVSMVRARHDAAARGEDITALWVFQDLGIEGASLSSEQQKWMWAHLRELMGYGPRPKYIPCPTIA